MIRVLVRDMTIGHSNQHIVPTEIEEEAKIALSHYPTLQNIPIHIRFKRKISSSTMLAQPDFWSILKPRAKRKYQILVSRTFELTGVTTPTTDIPRDVMIGWIGHELGHIMDYETRSNWALIGFGIGYLFSQKHYVLPNVLPILLP